MESLQKVLDTTIFNNTILDYLTSITIALAGIIIIWISDKFIVKKLKQKTEQTKNQFDDFFVKGIEKSLLPVFYITIIYIAINHLNLSEKLIKYIHILWIISITIFGLRFLANFTTFLIETFLILKEKDPTKIKNIRGLIIITKSVIWGLGIVLLLDNLGYKVSTVLAGLGIGGIAVALAAQTILGDLFSYVAILFDKPFEVGDFIIVNDLMGTVENVGIKTTRIRSLSGEELVFSNSDLTNSRIRNYKRMYNRRVVFQIGVVYNTPLEKLKKIPIIIKNIIENINDTKFDRAHFKEYGDFSLNYEIVYYVIGNDYNKYMDIQQEINFKLYEVFEKEKIEFAYPTQTIYVNKQ